MLLPAVPLIYRKRKNLPRPRRKTPAPAAPLTLVTAAYDKDLLCVDVAFDRAIDIAAIDVTAFAVDDDTFTASHLIGMGDAELLSPTTVRVLLNQVDGAMHPEIHLTVGAANGIVAVDDGGVWAGVNALLLPFP